MQEIRVNSSDGLPIPGNVSPPLKSRNPVYRSIISRLDESRRVNISNSLESLLNPKPDSPPPSNFYDAVYQPECYHIYSIPRKSPKSLTAVFFNERRQQDLDPMACSFVPSQCETTCNQILSNQDSALECPQLPQKPTRKNKTKCPLCGLEGSIETIQCHVSSCGLEGVACPSCNEFIHRGILTYHKDYLCSKRQVFCQSCGHNFIADQIQNHQSKCSLTNKNWTSHNSSSLTRTNNCDPVSAHSTLDNSVNPTPSSLVHTSTAPPNRAPRAIPRAKSSDTFEHSGVRVPQGSQDSVTSSSTPQGQSSTRVSSTHSYNMDPMMSAVAGHGYGSLFAKLEMLDKSLEGNEHPDEHVDHQSSVIIPCIFKDAGCHFQGSHYALSRHLDDSMKLHLAMTYSVMQHQQKQLLMVTSALAAAMNPNTDGCMLWKIRNFGEKLMEAKSGKRIELQSAVFYSSRLGYKLTLILYPDGYGSAKGSHISIFVKILRGDYDNFLQWPFPHTVKIGVLSQDQSRQHIVQRVSQKFNVISESTTPSGNTPRSGMSSSSNNSQSSGSSSSSSGIIGLPRFVSQELILSSQQYLLEETLVICASVMNADNNNNFRQAEVFPRTSEI